MYVIDNNAWIWRIRPGGTPEIWFRDARLESFAGIGQVDGAIGPDGRLYFSLTASALPDHLGDR